MWGTVNLKDGFEVLQVLRAFAGSVFEIEVEAVVVVGAVAVVDAEACWVVTGQASVADAEVNSCWMRILHHSAR